jgi:hypothetical protein
MGSPHVRSNGAAGPRPQLPAFCRSRRPVVTVSVSSLNALRLLVLLGLLFQLSTLLVVIAGPVPPRPVISSSHDFRPDAVSSTAGVPLLQPLSDR